MSTYIPIWPGSSSFTTGSTPFGYYDTDVDFVNEIDRFASWSATKLGYPIVDVELIDTHFYSAFEEATTSFSSLVNKYRLHDNLYSILGASTVNKNFSELIVQPNLDQIIRISKQYGSEAGSGGHLTYYTGSIKLSAGTQSYHLLEYPSSSLYGQLNNIEIKKIFHYGRPASLGGGSYGSSISSHFGNIGMDSSDTAGVYLMQPLYADLLKVQAIEFTDQIRRSSYDFQLINNTLRIFPIPQHDYHVYFQYINTEERANASMNYVVTGDSGSYYASGSTIVTSMANAPYNVIPYTEINSIGRQWIKDFGHAITTGILGQIRSKYQTVPIPGAEVSLNGSDLIAMSEETKEKLLTNLEEFLQKMTSSEVMNKLSEQTDAMQNILNKVPSSIYVF